MNRRKDCPARAVLEILGFEGLMDFSARAGVNHKTVGELLGIYKLISRKHHVMIIAVNDALHTAYCEKRNDLDKVSQVFVCAWAKRWQDDVIQNKWYEKRDEANLGMTAKLILDRRHERIEEFFLIFLAINSLIASFAFSVTSRA